MNIIEVYETWRAVLPSWTWPPITFGGDMDVTEILNDIEDYVTAKVLEGELPMGFINTHLDAIRTHIKQQASIKADLYAALSEILQSFANSGIMVGSDEAIKGRAAITKADGESEGRYDR